jgi:hypothetical protein
VKYDYAKGSFISAGYTYDLEETSDPVLFSDEKTNRMFVNIQHAFTGADRRLGSPMDYEPATARSARPSVAQPATSSEDTTHAGVALTYLPNEELVGHHCPTTTTSSTRASRTAG